MNTKIQKPHNLAKMLLAIVVSDYQKNLKTFDTILVLSCIRYFES
jgi:hypothetical protein